MFDFDLDAVSRFQKAPAEAKMEKVVIRMEMAPLWT
jgi:hypothetical protein